MEAEAGSSGLVEIPFAPRWRQWLAVAVGGLLAVSGLWLVGLAVTGQGWVAPVAFVAFWGGVVLVVFFAPTAARTDRVGLRAGQEHGLTISNTLLGRRLGTIRWADVADLADDGRGHLVVKLGDPAAFAAKVPRYLATRLLDGVPVRATSLAASELEVAALVRSVGEPCLRATGTTHATRKATVMPTEIRAVRSRCLQPWGMASRYLYILLGFLVLAAAMQLVLGTPTGTSAGLPTFIATLSAAIGVAAVNPGYGLVFLSRRVITVTSDGVDETGLAGRQRHHPFTGLTTVLIHDGLASFAEPTVSVALTYHDSPRPRIISGKGMPADQMRALGATLRAHTGVSRDADT